MNFYKIVLTLIVLSCFSVCMLQAQSVGINTTTPDTTAALDVVSTTKGMLVPRMNSAQRTGITLPAIGLLVFDTDTESFWYYQSSGWFELANGAFTNDGGVVKSTGNHSTDDFVFGSQNLPPGSSISDTLLFFDKSKGAFRTGSLSNSGAWGSSYIGSYSFSAGYNTLASGQYAVALGHQTEATGLNSTALGTSSKATGFFALTAGRFTKADAYVSSALGQYNVGGGSTSSWVSTDPIFEIGIGSGDMSRENAMTVLKNGDFIVGRENVPPATPITDTLMFFVKSKGAFRTGSLSNSGAWGSSYIGAHSFSAGYNTLASGQYAVAFGHQTEATGLNSTALGTSSKATGFFALTAGRFTKANAYVSSALGQYNVGGGSASSWVSTDPIFEIGIGSGDMSRENAMTVLKNGDFIVGRENVPPAGAITDTLMFFDKSKGALRSGVLNNSTAWAPDSIGLYSIALGYNTMASGFASTAMGRYTIANSSHSTAMGYATQANGYASTAMGYFNQGIGYASTAMGYYTEANSISSTAMGSYTRANESSSTAMGYFTHANGKYSTAMGYYTEAVASSSLAIGRFNVGAGDSINWVDTDPLFEIGNGSGSSSRNNALTVLKNGDFILGRENVPPITAISDTLMFFDKSKGAFRSGRLSGSNAWAPDSIGFGSVALGYSTKATNNYSTAFGYRTLASGQRATAMGYYSEANGSSSTALGAYSKANAENSIAIGYATEANGLISIALGKETIANGDYSTTMGLYTEANGYASTAMGQFSKANGSYSSAIGFVTQANGYASTAMGRNTNAIGSYSTAIGGWTKAVAEYSMSIGRYNVGAGDSINWVVTDPLLEVGIGTSEGNRKNAMTILKNGNVGIGTPTPDVPLEILSDGSATIPQLKLTESVANDGARIIFSNGVETDNRWTLYGLADDTDANSVFNIFYNGVGNMLTANGLGNIGIKCDPDADFHIRHSNSGGSGGLKLQNSTNDEFARLYVSSGDGNLRLYFDTTGLKGTFNDVNGVYSTVSDRRLKNNFQDLTFDWNSFNQLTPLTYTYNNDAASKRYIGMVAQDVLEIYPQLITYVSEEDRYTMDYSGFGVIAIKAIQEQQKIIDQQATVIHDQEERLQKVEAMLNTLIENQQ